MSPHHSISVITEPLYTLSKSFFFCKENIFSEVLVKTTKHKEKDGSIINWSPNSKRTVVGGRVLELLC